MHCVDIESVTEVHHRTSARNELHLRFNAFFLCLGSLSPPVYPASLDAFLFQVFNYIPRIYFCQCNYGTIDIQRKFRDALKSLFIRLI